MISGRSMVRALVAVGWLGVTLFSATALAGLRMEGPGDGLRLHLLLAVVSHALLLLVFLWTVIYLTATGRLVARVGRDGVAADHRRLRRRALPLVVVAAAATVTTLLSGVPVYVGGGSGRFHLGAAAIALLLQLPALVVTGRVLARGEEILRRLGAEGEG